MTPLFVALTAETLVAAACFVLFPAELPTVTPAELHGALGLARTLAMPRNALPSLHVAYALTVATALGERWRPAWLAWAAAIAASTVFTRQHWLLDVVGGAALGAWGVTRMRAVDDRWIATAAAELQAAREALRIARRHRRYLGIALLLWGGSLGRWRARRAARLGYALLQSLDDLLDGDRPCPGDPRGIADTAIGVMTCQLPPTADPLAAAYTRAIRPLAAPGEDPVATTVALVRVMIVDHERRMTRAVWDAERLRAQHRATFSGSLDLLLTAAGARLRARDVPALVEAFGPVSTLRDLDEDLAHGLCNVPAAVSAEAPASAAHLQATEAGRTWLASERARCRDALTRAHEELARADDPVGVRLLGVFARSMARYGG
jgi:hypothetical protein